MLRSANCPLQTHPCLKNGSLQRHNTQNTAPANADKNLSANKAYLHYPSA